ncbi:MAG: cyclic nucleotide-binding domain-containing protein [Desulfobacterales bacterium]|nr:cyclic nucleotide-binding domain-containing protein [Desulfobacterales bacterium]
MKETEFLRKVSFFSHMAEEDVQRIAGLAQQQVFQEGERIIREGERGDRLYVIISGSVDIYKNHTKRNERFLQTLGPRGYFGEMALLEDMIRSASVIAKEETRVMYIEKLSLQKEIERYPLLAIELLQVLNRRILTLEKRLVNTLETFLPICANCKKIRDENGVWTTLEVYISGHSETEFTHGICPDCRAELYPSTMRRKKRKKKGASGPRK